MKTIIVLLYILLLLTKRIRVKEVTDILLIPWWDPAKECPCITQPLNPEKDYGCLKVIYKEKSHRVDWNCVQIMKPPVDYCLYYTQGLKPELILSCNVYRYLPSNNHISSSTLYFDQNVVHDDDATKEVTLYFKPKTPQIDDDDNDEDDEYINEESTHSHDHHSRKATGKPNYDWDPTNECPCIHKKIKPQDDYRCVRLLQSLTKDHYEITWHCIDMNKKSISTKDCDFYMSGGFKNIISCDTYRYRHPYDDEDASLTRATGQPRYDWDRNNECPCIQMKLNPKRSYVCLRNRDYMCDHSEVIVTWRCLDLMRENITSYCLNKRPPHHLFCQFWRYHPPYHISSSTVHKTTKKRTSYFEPVTPPIYDDYPDEDVSTTAATDFRTKNPTAASVTETPFIEPTTPFQKSLVPGRDTIDGDDEDVSTTATATEKLYTESKTETSATTQESTTQSSTTATELCPTEKAIVSTTEEPGDCTCAPEVDANDDPCTETDPDTSSTTKTTKKSCCCTCGAEHVKDQRNKLGSTSTSIDPDSPIKTKCPLHHVGRKPRIYSTAITNKALNSILIFSSCVSFLQYYLL